jgi:hexulose-6-phosphate isomerase
MVIEMWSETSEHPAEEIKKAKSFILGKMQEAQYHG